MNLFADILGMAAVTILNLIRYFDCEPSHEYPYDHYNNNFQTVDHFRLILESMSNFLNFHTTNLEYLL